MFVFINFSLNDEYKNYLPYFFECFLQEKHLRLSINAYNCKPRYNLFCRYSNHSVDSNDYFRYRIVPMHNLSVIIYFYVKLRTLFCLQYLINTLDSRFPSIRIFSLDNISVSLFRKKSFIIYFK